MNIYGWPGQVAHTHGCELPRLFLSFFARFCCPNHFVSNAGSVSFLRVALFQKREKKRALTFWTVNRFPFQDRLGTRHEDDFAKTGSGHKHQGNLKS
jgi:hypothetical protein